MSLTRETFTFCCQCGDKFSIKETCSSCGDLVRDTCTKCFKNICEYCNAFNVIDKLIMQRAEKEII